VTCPQGSPGSTLYALYALFCAEYGLTPFVHVYEVKGREPVPCSITFDRPGSRILVGCSRALQSSELVRLESGPARDSTFYGWHRWQWVGSILPGHETGQDVFPEWTRFFGAYPAAGKMFWLRVTPMVLDSQGHFGSGAGAVMSEQVV